MAMGSHQMHPTPLNYYGGEAGVMLVPYFLDCEGLQAELDAEGKSIPSPQTNFGKSYPSGIAYTADLLLQSADLTGSVMWPTARIAQLFVVTAPQSEPCGLIGWHSRAPPGGIA